MHQRPTLASWKKRRVQFFFDLRIRTRQNDATSRTAQRLVGCRGHNVCIGNRAGVFSGSHETGNVGHVDQQIGANRIGNRSKLLPVQPSRISGKARDNHFGPVFFSQPRDVVVVDLASGSIGTVLHWVVQLARKIHRRAVGQVTAISQTHAQNRVASFQQGKINRGVSLGP